MTKSEFIRCRCKILVTTMTKLVHPEDRAKVESAVHLWAYELITDVNNLSSNDIDELQPDDKYGDTLLDEGS